MSVLDIKAAVAVHLGKDIAGIVAEYTQVWYNKFILQEFLPRACEGRLKEYLQENMENKAAMWDVQYKRTFFTEVKGSKNTDMIVKIIEKFLVIVEQNVSKIWLLLRPSHEGCEGYTPMDFEVKRSDFGFIFEDIVSSFRNAILELHGDLSISRVHVKSIYGQERTLFIEMIYDR